jgi:hypothetical protein
MAVKLLMTWDIIPGREQEYFEFVVREFMPGVQRLGMEPSDAWLTMYGKQPQIMAAMQMPTLNALEIALNTSEWESLVRQLSDFVEDYRYKIVPARGGFQL